MSNNKGIKYLVLTLVMSFCFTTLTQVNFAGCDDNYFKISHRQLKSFMPENYNDWNGDGHIDFWRPAVHPGSGLADILIYFGDGSGTWDFDNPTVYSTNIPGSLGENYRLFDHNHDGKTDILDLGRRAIYQNNGAGSLLELTPYFFPDEPFPQISAIADINGDNIPDLVTHQVINVSQNTTGYRLGNADGTFGSRVVILNDNPSIQPADFNGDGKIDLLSHGASSAGSFRVLMNSGKGTFTVKPQIEINPGANTSFYVSDVKDLNGDNKPDILITLYGNSSPSLRRMMILYGDGNGGFSSTEYSVFRPGEGAYLFKTVEFNGDTQPDIIGYSERFYSIYLNNGSGSFTRHDYTKPFGPLTFVSFVDLNEDGRDDIFSPAYYSQYPSTPFGQFVFHFLENTCERQGGTTRPDFDGDGEADIVRWNPSSGEWNSLTAKWLGQSSQVAKKTFTWGSGASGDIPAAGDYDGDGTTDYAVYRNSTGEWYIHRSSDSATWVLPFGLPGDIAVPGDYNGGGQTDLAVFRPSDGNWYVFYFETYSVYIAHFGSNGDKPVPADYDGDGKTDLAVYRPTGGLWFYLKSSDGNWGGANWGISTDQPLPADYDGDGRADIAVIRNSSDWYILRSSDYSFNLFYWGTGGDALLPIYRYPTSAEFVAYRPSTWYWYSYYFRDYGNASVLGFGNFGDVAVRYGLPNN